jgi:competence protein ComEA
MRGVILLIILIFCLFSIRIYLGFRDNKIHLNFSKTNNELVNFDQADPPNEIPDKRSITGYDENKLVQFDPNTANYDELINLSLKVPTAKNIIKYREKGGQFKHSEDILKIYGMDSNLYRRLQPYIIIKSVAVDIVEQKKQYVSFPGLKVDLNKADSIELKKIPGIGPVLSKRIVKYRDILGGYINTGQLKEVYGISDSLFLSIEHFLFLDTNLIIRININTCTLKDLEKHPYINHYQAKAIENYRKIAGPFKSKDQLLENYLLSEENYLKLSPYLTLN